MRPTRSRPPAFTLVELLVVIGIIGVLLAVLVPALAHARGLAGRTVCASNLRQIGLLIHAYASDNRGEIPVVYGGVDVDGRPAEPRVRPAAYLGTIVNNRGGVKLLVAPPVGMAQQAYTNSASVFLCPNGGSVLEPWGGDPNEFGYHPGWGPLPPDSATRGASYVYCYVPPGGDWYPNWSSRLGPGPAWSSRPPRWERGKFAGLERHRVSRPRAEATAVMYEVTLASGWRLTEQYRMPPWKGFHNYDGNVLFLDGHVACYRSADLHEVLKRGRFEDEPTAMLKALDRGVGLR